MLDSQSTAGYSAGAVRAEGPGLTAETFHMSSEELRRHGHRMVDWIVDYWDRVESLPVQSQAEPGGLRDQLPPSAPLHGEPFEDILADLDRLILPGVTHWQSPNFFGYFPANASGPSLLGEMLSAGLGVQGMLWATSPACTELETHMLDWLVEAMELPRGFRSDSAGGGVIQDSASSAVLCALLAARERATGLESNRTGDTRGLVAYASTETHSAIEKAIRVAGIGSESLRLVPVDDDFKMRPEELERMVAEDLDAGHSPFFVCATIGTTSSHAMDPLAEIGEICRGHGVWLHVDGAMAGTAALCPEFRFHLDGLDAADSYCFNPHKWMFTNFDCTCFWLRDRRALIEALAILPDFLRNQATASGEVIDYRDWQVPLGRRFRSLKLWFVLRHYGLEGLRHHVRRHVALAGELRGWIEDDDRFEIAAPTPLNLVCFRHLRGDEFNQKLMERLNSGGSMFLTSTTLARRLTLRLSIGQTHTERRHVEAAWRHIVATATAMEAAEKEPRP